MLNEPKPGKASTKNCVLTFVEAPALVCVPIKATPVLKPVIVPKPALPAAGTFPIKLHVTPLSELKKYWIVLSLHPDSSAEKV